MLASKVTDKNFLEFYQQIYRHQFDSADQLVNLTQYPKTTFVLVDCCGWHYKKLFPTTDITSVENTYSIKSYKLTADMYDSSFAYNPFTQQAAWTKIETRNPILVFDRSSFLRYLTVEDFSKVLQSAVNNFKPKRIIVRVNPVFVDDNRLTDRIHNLHNITVNGYVVEKFSYDVTTNNSLLEINFKANNE